MATTYTVTNTFTADTTAVASQVNANFTDVLTALNSFDITNCTGTIALARISNLTSTQMASTFFKDEDNFASNSATAVASQQSVKAYVDSQIAANVTMSAYTANDSDGNAMLKAHAYLANTDGFVSAQVSDLSSGQTLKGFVGSTNDPAGAGTQVQRQESAAATQQRSIFFAVASGEYFEVTTNGTVTILWKSLGTLSAPTDQD